MSTDHPARRLAPLILPALGLLGGCHWHARPASPEAAPAPAVASAPEASPEPAPEGRPAAPPEAAGQPSATDPWARIRAGLALPPVEHPRIVAALGDLLRHPRHVEHVSERAAPWLHGIVAAVEARGMPLELALIPAIESGYRARARSPSDAAGLWQLMPGTALHLGLSRDEWVDQRGDPEAATRAALDYLDYLHGFFDGDWLLALAAYNGGEGTVQRAVRRNRSAGLPAGYFHLDLPAETRRYVPRLLAFARIVRDPARHGVRLAPAPSEPALARVPVTGPVPLAALARASGVPPALLAELNADLVRGVTPPGRRHPVRVPAALRAEVRAAQASLPAAAPAAGGRHRVRPGETLSHVALRYGLAVPELKAANGLEADLIRVGQELRVPADGPRRERQAPEDVVLRMHEVRPGDSLWGIARRYRTSIERLARANDLQLPAVLRPGERLRVPAGPPPEGLLRHEVARGESLWTIARRYGVSVGALRRWNGISGDLLRPGDVLVLYPPAERPQKSI